MSETNQHMLTQSHLSLLSSMIDLKISVGGHHVFIHDVYA